jgi:hypothetical protein
VAAYRAALEESTRERVPLDWAGAQNNLGNALLTLGERETGTARLEEAVAAFRAALEERTRERVPLDWAMTQNNLGIALAALGEREAGTARLERRWRLSRGAGGADAERVPLDWAGHDCRAEERRKLSPNEPRMPLWRPTPAGSCGMPRRAPRRRAQVWAHGRPQKSPPPRPSSRGSPASPAARRPGPGGR